MSCPSLEQINLYLQKRLSYNKRADLEQHLTQCDQCRQLLKQTTENESLLSDLRESITSTSMASESRSFEASVGSVQKAQEIVGEQYQVIKKLSRGSSGEVFKAKDTILDRLVAIKFLPQESGFSKKQESNRWNEARLMGHLNHPNIVQIYHIGTHDNICFFVTEWITGSTISEAWQSRDLYDRLRLFLKVLDAVAGAHKRGIVHRDLKPSNILVNQQDQVKVLDFGIAVEKLSPEASIRNFYRGTPAFSAPEQLTSEAKITPATDVFALGVIMYELLTDTLPFPQKNQFELFNAIKSQFPKLPVTLQEKIPIALQNICLKALEKDPHQRYKNARALSKDINRFLKGEKVWSRPSFLMDKIKQELFFHRQKLSLWYENDLITQKEFDKLENVYQRLNAPADPSIIESRRLSFSQICLYLGGWIVVLGSFVLLYKSWQHVSPFWRPFPAMVAISLMATLGIILWLKKQSRLAIGFLATTDLMIPIVLIVTLAQWQILPPQNYPWGIESITRALQKIDYYLLFGNLQLYISSWFWLFFSIFLLRMTRSSIFVMFTIASFLMWLSTAYIISGMETWPYDVLAGRYLLPGMIFYALGILFDRLKYPQYSWPAMVTGFILIILPLSVIALSKNTLFGWAAFKPTGLAREELVALSFTFNGIIYLALATLCRSIGTILQRRIAKLFSWLGPIHVLATLRILDLDSLSLPSTHRLVYRILLPVTSFAYAFASVIKQMKSFFFSGLAGLAAAIHKLTIKHFDKFFAWPISLIAIGIIWMLIAWLVPSYKAKASLKSKTKK